MTTNRRGLLATIGVGFGSTLGGCMVAPQCKVYVGFTIHEVGPSEWEAEATERGYIDLTTVELSDTQRQMLENSLSSHGLSRCRGNVSPDLRELLHLLFPNRDDVLEIGDKRQYVMDEELPSSYFNYQFEVILRVGED